MWLALYEKMWLSVKHGEAERASIMLCSAANMFLLSQFSKDAPVNERHPWACRCHYIRCLCKELHRQSFITKGVAVGGGEGSRQWPTFQAFGKQSKWVFALLLFPLLDISVFVFPVLARSKFTFFES